MLKCTMIHSYPREYFDLYQLAENGFTFRQWNNEVLRIANSRELNLDEDARNKFKGDMLEVFSEIFFYQFQTDEALGITEYQPIEINDDYGVDARGINVNGKQTAIQVKYRSNPEDKISYADIARTFTSAVLQLHMKDVIDNDRTVFLFTNAGGVTGAFDTVMQKKTVIITRAVIATKVDNNVTFWKNAFDMMWKTLD
jgi:hypothetical protein